MPEAYHPCWVQRSQKELGWHMGKFQVAGGRTFGRWRALWVFLIMTRCTAEGGKSSPALLVQSAHSALHQLRALHCAPVREGGREGWTERRNMHTMWISDIHIWYQIVLFK